MFACLFVTRLALGLKTGGVGGGRGRGRLPSELSLTLPLICCPLLATYQRVFNHRLE